MRPLWTLLFAIPFTLSLAGAQVPDDPTKEPAKAKTKFDPDDEEFLRRAQLGPDAKVLLAFLKKRTLTEAERPQLDKLARLLGSNDYRTREKAFVELVKRGAGALEVLHAQRPATLEAQRRVEAAIQSIRKNDCGPETRAAAVRVLAQLQTDGLIEALLGYLPYADHPSVVEEIRHALLQNAVRGGKADPALLAALTDRSALRRGFAAETLARTAHADHKDDVRKRLTDDDPWVRYRAARGLAFAQDKNAVPILIHGLTELPINDAWRAEELLMRLAGPIALPEAAMSNAMPGRVQCQAAWNAWWAQHAGEVDFTKLRDDPKPLGRTLIILLDEKMVAELGPDNQPRWEIHDLNGPLDVQLLGDDHVLIAEHYAHRVTVRNLEGKIVWHKLVQGPQLAQRLSNGNTFVVTENQFLEFDPNGRLVDSVQVSELDRYIRKAVKLDSGEILCATSEARVVRYGPAGKELSSFRTPMAVTLSGGRIQALPGGRVLIPHSADNKVVEYDSRGKIVWELACREPIVATRTPSGNTIVTSMDPAVGAVEYDRAGVEVWSYRTPTRVTRAIRR